MRKAIIIGTILLLSLMVMTGCGNVNEVEPDDVPVDRWAVPPMVFVNDTYYQAFEHRQHIVPEVDEAWVYLGEIQSTAPGYELPAENFQTNRDMIGARIYHAYNGQIPITTSAWGDAIEEEIIGDSIIVVYEGQRFLYISEKAHSEAIRIMNLAERHSLLVDGVMYSLMATAFGDNFSMNDDFIFLGEVKSAVSLNELPAENLQANREIVVGARVYRLPPDAVDDIVVLHQWGTRFYYSALPRRQ